MLPAGPVPVPAEIRRLGGNDHQVAQPRWDLLHASRAQVGLDGLEGMEVADLEWAAQRGINAHSSIIAMAASAAPTIT